MLSRRMIMTGSLMAAVVFLPFSTPLCHASLGVFLLAHFSNGRWRARASLLAANPFAWTYILLFALHLAGVAWSDNVQNGWFNVEKKITLLLLPIAFVTLTDLDERDIRRILLSFVGVCLAATIACLAVAAFGQGPVDPNFDGETLSMFHRLNPSAGPAWMNFSYVALASGIGMHPTYLAMYLVFCVLILYHFYVPGFKSLSPGWRILLLLTGLYLVVFVVLLSSRAVTLTLFCFCIAGSVALFRRNALSGLAMAAVAACIVLVMIIDPVPRYRTLQEPFVSASYEPNASGLYAYSTGIRKSLWILGGLSIADVNPLFGAGTGDVEDTLRKMSVVHGMNNSLHSYDPHNEFIFIQVALGLVGFVCFLAALLLPAWAAWRERKYLYLAFIFLFLLVCMTESVLESQKGIVFFSIFNFLLVFRYCKLEPVIRKKLVYG